MPIYGNMIGGNSKINVLQLEMEDGTILEGVIANDAPVITATPKDVRKGKTFIASNGVVEGQKDIPSYRTHKGIYGVFPGEQCSIPLSHYDLYNYTKLQCIIAPYNTTLENSVAANKVVINDYLYEVNSTEILSTVTKNAETKSIDLNIINTTDNDLIVHYFTYKKEE